MLVPDGGAGLEPGGVVSANPSVHRRERRAGRPPGWQGAPAGARTTASPTGVARRVRLVSRAAVSGSSAWFSHAWAETGSGAYGGDAEQARARDRPLGRDDEPDAVPRLAEPEAACRARRRPPPSRPLSTLPPITRLPRSGSRSDRASSRSEAADEFQSWPAATSAAPIDDRRVVRHGDLAGEGGRQARRSRPTSRARRRHGSGGERESDHRVVLGHAVGAARVERRIVERRLDQLAVGDEACGRAARRASASMRPASVSWSTSTTSTAPCAKSAPGCGGDHRHLHLEPLRERRDGGRRHRAGRHSEQQVRGREPARSGRGWRTSVAQRCFLGACSRASTSGPAAASS